MIIDGQIKVKSGPKLQGFDETGALFDDGSKVDADVVVIATGYENVRETITKLCAPEINENIKPIWGLDEEFELNSVWRDCGVDKMWILFGMVEFLRSPYRPLNFHPLRSLENRKHSHIEVSFTARGAPDQSQEGRNLQWREILVIIYQRVGLITDDVSERNIYSRLQIGMSSKGTKID